MKKKGLLIVISGPSGAGKGTVYNEVLIRRPEIERSISVTTRAPRKGEVDGVHYFFKTEEEYQKMIANGEFLETAEVYNNFYGTPKAPVYEKLSFGHDVMFEIDTLGAKQIKRICAISGQQLPQRFIRLVDRYGDSDAAMKQAGIAYATEQIIDLYANGVNAVHIYSMNKPDVAEAIRNNVSEIIK